MGTDAPAPRDPTPQFHQTAYTSRPDSSSIKGRSMHANQFPMELSGINFQVDGRGVSPFGGVPPTGSDDWKDSESYEQTKKRQKAEYRINRDRERIASGKLPKSRKISYKASTKRYDDEWDHGYAKDMKFQFNPKDVYRLTDKKRKKLGLSDQVRVEQYKDGWTPTTRFTGKELAQRRKLM